MGLNFGLLPILGKLLVGHQPALDRALSCRHSVIKDQSSLKAFHRSVSGLGYMKLQTTPQLVLAVCPVAKDTGSLVPRAKRGGKVAQYEADTRALREMLYGKGSGRGRQGQVGSRG